jgi:hypothetical protein
MFSIFNPTTEGGRKNAAFSLGPLVSSILWGGDFGIPVSERVKLRKTQKCVNRRETLGGPLAF